MPRPRTRESRIYWKDGRAYADFRDFKLWGGRREALKPAGEPIATTEADQAAVLYAARLEALQALKKKHPEGLPIILEDPLARFGPFVAHHIAQKELLPAAKRPTAGWIAQQESWLTLAAGFFQKRGTHTLASIGADDVKAWIDHLRKNPPTPARPLNDGTLRKVLDTLGNLFRRAEREGRVEKNPVGLLLAEEKPTAGGSETIMLEIPDAALYLEACRRWAPDRDAGAIPFLHELVATYLLTGGREAEITGMLVTDVDFDRDLVHIRPNAIRASLKTLKKSRAVVRAIPLPPQLKEILRAYLDGPRAPAGPLLFPGSGPRTMLTDFRKALDAAARLAGFPPGMMRTRVFRVTWVSARLQCLDNGHPISPFTVAREAGHGSLKMVQQVYGRLGTIRQRREHVEYAWADFEGALAYRLDVVGTLSPRHREALAALPRAGAPAKVWEKASGIPAGSFYLVRDRLVERGLVVQRGQGRGSLFLRTATGDQALAR